jgi:hypothetical protein
MIEDFQGALSYDDILYKYTIPQLWIMRIDKPTVEIDDEDTQGQVNSAEDFLALINNRKK